MRSTIRWTPILHNGDPKGRSDADASESWFADATLPRRNVGDAHPLVLPRVKQRVRRVTAAKSTERRSRLAAGDGGSSGGGESDIGLVTSDGDGSLALPRISSSTKSDLGSGIVTDEDTVPATTFARVRQPLFDHDDRDVKIAVAGLSDDPLSLMMEERAVATNMSRHLGDILDHDAAGSAQGIKAGNPLQDLDSREGVAVGMVTKAKTVSARGRTGPLGATAGAEQEKGRAAWGTRWEAHLEKMLKRWGVDGGRGDDTRGGGNSAADQAAGPSKNPNAPVPPRPKNRFDTRLQELEASLSGGSGGGGRKAKNVSGAAMTGGLLLTSQEYTAHVSDLRKEVEEAWSKDEKVAALKAAVQAAKLLGDVSVPTFYPALFSMVASLLEAFGTRVFGRILARAEDPFDDVLGGGTSTPSTASHKQQTGAGDKSETQGGAASPPVPPRHALPEGWTSDDIGAEARETCRNWFYKTACIRELLPRIVIEAALLPCYRFLAAEDEFGRILGRLSTLVRGVGDPMVAAYCSCFIAAAGAKVAPKETAHAVGSLQDYFFSLQEVQQGKLASYFRATGLGDSEYLRLHTPAIEWLLDVVAPGAPRSVFTTILKQYRNHCGSLEMLRLILERFGPEHYSPFALEMVLLIKQGRAGSSPCTSAEVMGLLGKRLRANPPPGPDAVPLLNEAWQEIAEAPLEVYIDGAAAWLSVLLCGSSYGPDEVSILVADVASRIDRAKPPVLGKVRVQEGLSEGVIGTLAAAEDVEMLQVAGAHFVKLLSALDKGRRAQACLHLLEASLRTLVKTVPPIDRQMDAKVTGNGTAAAGIADAGGQSKAQGAEGDGGGVRSGESVKRKGRRGATELARALVGVAKLLHDSFDLLASGERQRQSATELTCDLVERIGRGWESKLVVDGIRSGGGVSSSTAAVAAADDGGGTDERSRLAILAECRRAFWNMDEVTDRLVLSAVGLSIKAWRAGANSTARAGLCFCSLTVPSVPSPLRRLALLQLCANAALRVGKPALADAMFRSAICVVPECSPLVVSGSDLGASAAVATASSLELAATPNSDTGESSGVSTLDPLLRTATSSLSGAYGRIGSSGGVSGLAVGALREHAGAWLLAEAVRSLLAALVAVPGHPELGPFYLLRGLMKAIRRLPWPAGSGILASLYIAAVGALCAEWQKRLPYSIKPTALNVSFDEDDGRKNGGGVGVHEVCGSVKGDHDGKDIMVNDVARTMVGVADKGHGDPAAAAAAASVDDRDVENANRNENTVEVDEEKIIERVDGEGRGDAGEDLRAVASGHDAEEGAGPQQDKQRRQEEVELKRSWLDVGGVLGNDDLYLRTSAYLEEIEGLLGEVVMATLKELEELWDLGEAELSSIMSSDHTRTARIRYARLSLDLANQLVSNVRMEGGAAKIVVFLIEAAARAGARSGSVGTTSNGSSAAYFKETVDFVSRVAQTRLERARGMQRRTGGSSEAEELEETCLTLLQGMSGFTRAGFK